MAEINRFDQLAEFRPFYDVNTTERLLQAYSIKPQVFQPELVSQLKDHAVHYKLTFPEPAVGKPKDADFNLLRGIRQTGEGFLSGFSTFQVGDPSDNEYERIMRSVGQLAGFVGYLPTAPGKILKSQTLIDMAKSLRGKSVPMWLSKQAKDAARPIVSNTLNKAAQIKNSSYQDAAKFLLKDTSKHVIDGAFGLGVATAVSSWQYGILEMIKSGAHGAVTGGAFRGIANLVNKGGIPLPDPLTGKYVLNASQKEDRMIRAAASSMYEGLQSSYRGETTPEQVYSYLLGAFFGAHETTAGQQGTMKFLGKVEKQAMVHAKALKRLNKQGKPYNFDTAVYDPRLVEGWDKLPADQQTAVMQSILRRHGTYASQAAMAGEVIEGSYLESLLDTEIAINDAIKRVPEAQEIEKSVIIKPKVPIDISTSKIQSPNFEVDKLKLSKANKLVAFGEPGSVPEAYKNAADPKKVNPGKYNKDDVVGYAVNGAKTGKIDAERVIKELEKAVKANSVIVGEPLKNRTKITATGERIVAKFLRNNNYTDIGEGIWVPISKAEKTVSEVMVEKSSEKTDDHDIGTVPDMTIAKRSEEIVNKHFPNLTKDLSSQEAIKVRRGAYDRLGKILNKHYTKYKGKTVDSESFIDEVTKAFPDEPALSDIAKGELRQLLIRKNMSKGIPLMTYTYGLKEGSLDGELLDITAKNPKNAAGNLKFQEDTMKAIDIAYERIRKPNQSPDDAYKVIDSVSGKFGNKYKEIELKKLNNRKNFRGRGGRNNTAAETAYNSIISSIIKKAEARGYLYNGGKGATGRMYFVKEHPDIVKAPKKYIDDQVRLVLETMKLKNKNAEKHFKALRERWAKKRVGLGGKDKARDYFNKSFLSNLLWERELYGIKNYSKDYTKQPFIEWILDHSQIRDAKGFNKRNQIWFTDGYEADTKFFNKVYHDAGGDKSTSNGKIKFRLFKDANGKDKDGNDLTKGDMATLYTEATDGSILAEEGFVNALNKTFGHPSSGQNKSFIVGNDPVHGALLGKFMFQKASPEGSKWMRDEGIQLLIPESAAKEYGTRRLGDLSVGSDLSVSWKGKDYEMNISDIKGSLSEKQSHHMLEAQKIPKQLMSNLVAHADSPLKKAALRDFFDNLIGNRYIGKIEWNNRLNEALSKESGNFSDIEQDNFLRNMDKIGLPNIVDAITNRNHPTFVSKLYQRILRTNSENLTDQFQSGEISHENYAKEMGDIKNFNSNIDRLMKIYPDYTVFLHKNVRNYVQAAMRNYVVNRVIRPKWEHSISGRIRGLDPWLAAKFPEMNFNTSGKGSRANNKILKEKYGVKNPDELFFLDDMFKNVTFKVGDIVGEKKPMRLEDLWNKYGQDPKYKDSVQEFFNTIGMRVPMDSISGAHKLKFGGFTGIEGHGVVLHPRTMKALGGADLDGDKVSLFFGFKKEWKDMYHSNKNEFIESDGKTIKPNKRGIISSEAKKILSETLDSNDPHLATVLKKINNNEDITFRDLLTTTNDGAPFERELNTSFVGKYAPFSRMNMADNGAKGRDQLGPAVIQKQVLNATYDALVNNPPQRYISKKTGQAVSFEKWKKFTKKNQKNFTPDNSEEIRFSPIGTNKLYIVKVTPRTSPEELKYSRELMRAQIGFGSDPLDELGLAGGETFFNTAWHSLFKAEGPKDALKSLNPHYHARQGLLKIFQDFQKGYFSRNWDQNRRYYAHEILEMSQGIKILSAKQKDTMLARMVEVLEPLNYTDNMLAHVKRDELKLRYKDYHQGDAKELTALNARYKDPDGAGGLLGRRSFKSPDNELIYKAIKEELFIPGKIADMLKPQNTKLYKDFFKDIKVGEFGKKSFWIRSFPEEHPSAFKDSESLSRAINQSEYYRGKMVDKAYRLASDSVINDAMDRTSAAQLLKSIKMARDTGTSDLFINKMSKFAEHIKKAERAKRTMTYEKMLQNETLITRLDENNKMRVVKLFEIDPKLKPFAMQHKIDQRILDFKTNNAWKKKNSGTAKLSAEENYLLDTMMLNTFYRGDKLNKLNDFYKLPPNVRKLLNPILKDIEYSGSGTYFSTVGLDSPMIHPESIRDFFVRYSEEFKPKEKFVIDQDTKVQIEYEPTKEKIRDSKPDIWEDEIKSIRDARKRALEVPDYQLKPAEREMVDELVSHLHYYHNSVGTAANLNIIARGLRMKNFDAFTLEDYRILNNYFRDWRSGNMFIKDGKLTSENIPKLSERHYMLFPRQISEELMVKDFKIFEQEGFFQNYAGEPRRGIIGRPTQVIENVQWVLGRTQDSAIKKEQDEKETLHSMLRRETGYETLEKGQDFIALANEERNFRAWQSQKKYSDPALWHIQEKLVKDALDKARKTADWENNENKVFNIQGDKWTGRQIVDKINNILTKRSQETFSWISGKHHAWNEKTQAYEEIGKHPLDKYTQTDKQGKLQYWDLGRTLPKIKTDEITKFFMEEIKSGRGVDITEFGLDNLRRINRSIAIEKLISEQNLVSDVEIKKGYNDLIKSLQKQSIYNTSYFHPNDYAPHFIENKAVAKSEIIRTLEKLKAQTGMDKARREKEIIKLINQYKQMTGEYITEDIIEDQMIQGALNEVATKKRGEHLDWFKNNISAANMNSRSSWLPGWANDIGSWEIYQKNLIDTHYRGIGQILSKKMLQEFNEYTEAIWKDKGQTLAWNNFVSDYISRSMGNPSKIPERWLDGPEGNLMKIKGTPFNWFADNHVKNLVNRIKKKLGFSGDFRLPEELRGIDEYDLRHWSNIEAKYEMATLLAHPKSSVANIFGGTLHTIQSTGWRHWKNSRNLEYLRTFLGKEANNWKGKEDIDKWVIGHGVIPDFILYEAGLNPNFKTGKWKLFLNDAVKKLKKDPSLDDISLRALASKHKITEAAFQKAAWFMREPERMLRKDSFVAHYLQAREKFGHANMPLDHPLLIEMAKKGVQATQFLYSAPYRPAFSTTALGKVMTRFQAWAWNSVRFRNDTIKQAKIYGFREGTEEFERFKRQYLSDMFVFALGNVFAYSLFENAMPAPWNWFQDTADWIFGNENERDRAFFGQWPTAIAPLQMVTPPGLRLVPAVFNSLVNDDYARLTDYYMMTMFPFGRMARDIKGVVQNPSRGIEKATGLPYMQFAREATKLRPEDEDE